MFLIKEFFKSFVFSKKTRVGFVLDVLPAPYNQVMASTRLRVYDVIKNFSNDPNFFLELYKPWKKYDIVIFQKSFDEKALRLAKNLRNQGVKIVLDVNVNFYDKKALIKRDPNAPEQITEFTKICDYIITTTSYLKNYINDLFPGKPIYVIPENITQNFFSVQKKHQNNTPTLLYVGYSIKAKEIFLIEDVLKNLRKKYNFKILFICEKDPKINIDQIETEFLKYNQKKIHKQMLLGDIFISPRDTKDPYNLGHSFNRIGYPMSVGIPVIASTLPSYKNSPALLCDNNKGWIENIEKLMRSPKLRGEVGQKGIDFCKENFSSSIIKKQYINFLKKVINES